MLNPEWINAHGQGLDRYLKYDLDHLVHFKSLFLLSLVLLSHHIIDSIAFPGNTNAYKISSSPHFITTIPDSTTRNHIRADKSRNTVTTPPSRKVHRIRLLRLLSFLSNENRRLPYDGFLSKIPRSTDRAPTHDLEIPFTASKNAAA